MASNGADNDALISDSCDLDMRDLLKKMSYPREQRATAKDALDIVESKNLSMYFQVCVSDKDKNLDHKKLFFFSFLFFCSAVYVIYTAHKS